MARVGIAGTVYLCLVGFALSGNLILASGGSLRLLDLAMLLGACMFMFLLATKPFSPLVLWVLLLIGYFLIFILRGLLEQDPSLVFASGRAILALMTGCVVGTLLANGPHRMRIFCLAGGLGALAVAWIAMGQLLLRSPLYMGFLPDGAKMFWYDGRVRATGIWEHPNGLGQMQAIGTMMGLSLAFLPGVGRGWRVLGLGLFIATVLMTYSATQTRSYLLASAICLMIAMNTGTSRKLKSWAQLASLFFAILLPLVARPLLGERWFGETSSGQTALSQAGERLMTKLDSLLLTVGNPLGYGFEGRLQAQLELNGKTTASHDAILSFALTFGLPMGLLVAGALIACYRRVLLRLDWPHPLFLPLVAVTILFQFEDSLFSPSMMLFLPIVFFSFHEPVFGDRRGAALLRAAGPLAERVGR